MSKKIKVEYTGDWPNMCSGDLIVYRNNEIIYRTDKYSFRSTASVGFLGENYTEPYVGSGELKWNDEDYDKFSKWAINQEDSQEIIAEVNKMLESVEVCCGGCL